MAFPYSGYERKLRMFHIIRKYQALVIGEGRVRRGWWVRQGACLIEKTIKSAMLIFWHRRPMMLPNKQQYKQTQHSLLFFA